MRRIKMQKGESSRLNNVDRGFEYMLSPENTFQEENTFFNKNIKKVITLFNKKIEFSFTLKITPKEK